MVAASRTAPWMKVVANKRRPALGEVARASMVMIALMTVRKKRKERMTMTTTRKMRITRLARRAEMTEMTEMTIRATAMRVMNLWLTTHTYRFCLAKAVTVRMTRTTRRV